LKLLINTATTFKGGGIQVALSFLEECRIFQENDYYVILGIKIAKMIDINNFPNNFTFFMIDYKPADRVLFSMKSPDEFMRKIEKKYSPDCVFTTSGPAYWRPSAPHLVGYNLPHFLYYDSPYFTLNIISRIKKVYWGLKSIIIKYYFRRDSEYYVVQTNDVKKRLFSFIGMGKKHIYVVSNSYSKYYKGEPKYTKKYLENINSTKKKLLYFSSFYSHKNFKIINQIARLFEKKNISDYIFITTIDQKYYNNIFNSSIQKYIFNVGPIHPKEGPALYDECTISFIPTLMECFSVTYLESMIKGTPILTSDLSFSRAVCGRSALYFSPNDPNDALNKIQLLSSSPDLRKKLITFAKKRVLSFDSSVDRAEKYLSICESIINT
jgi:glycosyltransferase involved in cell wall biosynthesis